MTYSELSASEREMTDHAIDVLADWLPGYTTPDEGPQKRIRITANNKDSISVSTESVDHWMHDPRVFRIKISVEEIVTREGENA